MLTGLLAGLLTDAAGPGARRADLASAVQQVLGPARVWLRISQCDRDGLNRDRRWRKRSQADRGFDRQRAQGPDVFAVALGHGGPPHPRSAPGRAMRGQDGEVPDVSPVPACTRIPNTGSQRGFRVGTMDGCVGSCRHDVPSWRQNRGATAPGPALFVDIRYCLTASGTCPAQTGEGGDRTLRAWRSPRS